MKSFQVNEGHNRGPLKETCNLERLEVFSKF